MQSGGFEQNEERCIVRPRSDYINDEKCIIKSRYGTLNSTTCSVCGGKARRLDAKFCRVCGHNLREDYAPVDGLRASYNFRHQVDKQQVLPLKPNEMENLFAKNRNGAASTATAFVVYSLVPYLGILFCPGALMFGGIGLAISLQRPQLGGRRSATYSLLLGSIVFVIQILLWWLLSIVPELNK